MLSANFAVGTPMALSSDTARWLKRLVFGMASAVARSALLRRPASLTRLGVFRQVFQVVAGLDGAARVAFDGTGTACCRDCGARPRLLRMKP